MHTAEWEEMAECADCAEPIGERSLAFAFGDELLLCPECVTRRGGQYDPTADYWVVAPSLEGLDTPEG